MTFDLQRTLMELAGHGEAGAGEAPTERMAGLIHRRRTARTAARAAIGAVAAGVLVLGGLEVAGRNELAPATPPATCGTDARALRSSAGGDLDGPAVIMVAGLEDSRVSGSTQTTLAGRRLDLTVGVRGNYVTPYLPSEAPQVVIAQDGTIVAALDAHDATFVGRTDELPDFLAGESTGDALTDYWLFRATGPLAASVFSVFSADLVACPTAEADPDGTLAAGEYDVYAYQDYVAPGGVRSRALVGPLSLGLVDSVAQPVVMPEGFPTGVPLVDGELIDATGDAGAGWAVTIRTDGTDGMSRAVRRLEAAGFADAGRSDDGAVLVGAVDVSGRYFDWAITLTDGSYDVTVGEESSDGRPGEVGYRISAR